MAMSDGKKLYLMGYHEVDRVDSRHLNDLVSPARVYKIGVTKSPQQRKSVLSVGTPNKLTLDAVVESDDAERVEELLHHLYWIAHETGEWYKILPNDVNSLKALDYIDSDTLEEALEGYNWPVPEKSLYVKYMETAEAGE